MDVEISRLSNGLTIATQRMAQIESVALGIWVKSGSRNERYDQHGIAHLLEHMAFKGTTNRSAFKIATDIEDVGGEINAATSTETTAYYARVLKNDVPLAIDILSDIMLNSVFDEEELEREKHVVLQEIGAANDIPEDIVFDHFSETAFRLQPLGRPILGTAETVQNFTSDDLRAFMAEHYGADRMVIVATGAVDHDKLVKEFESRLAKFQAHSTARIADLANYVGGDYREFRDLKDAQIILGFEGRAYHIPDYYGTQLLSIILGGGMSSRLFQEVREKHGLCYSISAFHWGFSDTGLFGIHAATGKEGLIKLMPIILEELYKISAKIDPGEVDRARAQYRANLIISSESPSSRANVIARQMLLYGRPIPNSELIERLEGITAKGLADLAKRLFSDTKPTVAGVGPVETLMAYDDLTRSLSIKSL